jgi:N-acetyl-anhydromuramyl-L-alanine amidase AmpD
MEIIKKYLSKGNFIERAFPKKHIVLHHTVSSTVDSTWNWWENDFARDKKGNILKDKRGNPIKSTIGTAFLVDTDGDVIQCFPSKFMAHHLGISGAMNLPLTESSIGIELINEGPITMVDKSPRWLVDKKRPRGAPFNGEVVELGKVWRGHTHFAAYRDKQYESTRQLIDHLCNEHGIVKNVCTSFDFDMRIPSKHSVYSHCNVRRDKTDVSMAFKFERII